ncbi:MAG: hypothetical protein V3W11_07465 [bacterium]
MAGLKVNILVVTETRGVVEFVEASPREKQQPSFNVACTREVPEGPTRARRNGVEPALPDISLSETDGPRAVAAFGLLAPEAAVLVLTPPKQEKGARRRLARSAPEYVVAGRITEEQLHQPTVYDIAGQWVVRTHDKLNRQPK